ncbi:hypothetical protein D9M68_257350 [compost metagenome]
MSRQEKLYDELVELAYECALDESAWQPLLERLMPATGHQQGTLLIWDQRQTGPQLGSVNLLDPASVDAYNNHYCEMDPGRDFTASSPAGFWYRDTFHLGAERMRRHPYYQELYRPFNLHTTACLKLHEADQVSIFLSLLTQRDARLPSQEQHQLLERLTPHLVRAGRMASRINTLIGECSRRDLLLDQQRTAQWLVDAAGKVVHQNLAAEQQLLTPGGPLTARNGLLRPQARSPEFLLLLRQATDRHGPARAGWLALDDTELLVIPVPQQHRLASSSRPLALVALLHNRPRSELLAEVFQLTPAERRLAELITQGLSPEQCGLRLGVTINTVRSQLRALFRKTETERQTELVGLFTRVGQR